MDISYANIPAGKIIIIFISFTELIIHINATDLTDRMFTCEQARKRFAQIDISCEDDGSYSPRQCNRHHFQGRCVCVDPNTGEWLTEYPAFRENDRIDCITCKIFCSVLLDCLLKNQFYSFPRKAAGFLSQSTGLSSCLSVWEGSG